MKDNLDQSQGFDPLSSTDKNGKTAYDLLKMNNGVDSVNKDKCLRCVVECWIEYPQLEGSTQYYTNFAFI